MHSFTDLINYDEWANRQVFELISENEHSNVYAEALKLFSHILAAQLVWMSRVNSEKPKVEIWPEWSLEECENRMKQNPANLMNLLEREEEMIEYSNSKGVVFTNRVAEILQHLVIHGQHHRAQISMLYSKAGIKPPATDFIFFLRQKRNSRKA